MVSALHSGSNSPGSSPGQGTALCSWARHFTLIVPLSTQVYKWVPANLGPFQTPLHSCAEPNSVRLHLGATLEGELIQTAYLCQT